MLNESFCPLFVVIRSTPFAPLSPYLETSVPSFKTETLSISNNANDDKSLSNPSTNTNILLLFNDATPRMNISGFLFHGSPPFCKTISPLSFPYKLSAGFSNELFSNLSE